MGSTVSVNEVDAEAVVDGVPCLVRVLNCDRPLGTSERISLEDIDRVSIGRGDTSIARRERDITITVSDEKLSTEHAKLERQVRRFVLQDCGSKNGTVVNGRRIEASVELADGDVVEVGHTFFVYR